MLRLSSLSSPAFVVSHDLYEVACAERGALECIHDLMSTSTGLGRNSHAFVLVRKLHGVLMAEQVAPILASGACHLSLNHVVRHHEN